ncbi:hypothetical protein KFZ56_00145 [Virgibacillus sp. NKC19-3]|uniref:hypothetical protein n=1 Tax=Virgibacillus saliphilus TaxID=2831674 RepID=UPI001C9ADAB6|nr:hypothetical protein [Virgibacillus sp. NKC19-3]MBY7141542.1 hypothetical protein [Virgibacillus sp. NKC19-3]
MKWFVYLYPKTWRKRYGNELMDVLEHTDKSFKTIVDLLFGIIDAWNMELTERNNYWIRIGQMLVFITLINAIIVLKVKPLNEVILVEQVAMAAVLIAMLSLLAAVVAFIVGLFKFGVEEGYSFKTKLLKTSVGFMGVYGIFTVTFLVLIK